MTRNATRRSLLTIAGTLVSVALGGCTVVTPGTGNVTSSLGQQTSTANRTPEQRRADFPIDHQSFARLGYRLDWVGYPTVTGTHPIRLLAPYDEFVAVVEQGGRLSILETNTGARRCGDQVGSHLTRFMGLERSGDLLLVATQAEVFGLDPVTCNLRHRFSTEKIVSTGPVVHQNRIIFGTGAGEILAHAIVGSVEGVKAWGFAVGAAIEGQPVLVGSTIGAVAQNGQVTFVDAQTGRLSGRARIWGGLATNPVADEHTMFVASLDQSIYAFAADGGTQLWRHRTPYALRKQPTLHETEDGTVLYAAIPGQGLVALDGGTGRVLWTTPDFDATVVAINRGRLVAFDGESAALIDPRRGDIIERVTLPGAHFLQADKFVDGNLYIVSRSGVVARFNVR